MKIKTIKKIVIGFCCSVLLSHVSNAQTFHWAKSMGGTNVDAAYDLALDASGNVYTTGQFRGTADLDPGAGTANFTAPGSGGWPDAYVTKMDAAGNFVWAKQIGGTTIDQGTAVSVDASGNVYVCGDFSGTVDFDPGAGVYNLTAGSAGYQDFFVMKLDASGNFLWAKSFGGTLSDYAYGLALTSTNQVVVTGLFQNTVDFDPGAGTVNLVSPGLTDVFVLKLDSNGNYVWAGAIAGTNTESGNDVVIDASDNILLTGRFAGTTDFDPGAGTYNLVSQSATHDIFICKLTSAGNFSWAGKIGGASVDYGQGIATDPSGNVYVTGFFESLNVDFNIGAGTNNLSSGLRDAFVLKMDASGNYLWAKSFQGSPSQTEEGEAVAVDANGNVYVTGRFDGLTDFNPGTGVSNFTPSNYDGFVCKLNSTGNFLSAYALPGSSGDAAYDIEIDASNNIYTCGSYQGTGDFDPTSGISTLTALGSIDIFVHKMGCLTNAAPVNTTSALNLEICANTSTTLSVTAYGSIGWYTSSVGGTYLGGGSTFNTGALSSSTTFYVQDSTCAAGPRTAISVAVNPAPMNQLITPANTSICSGGNATITVAGTESDVYYSLVNNTTSAVVAGPTLGTGSAMNFNLTGITSTTTYNVTAVKPQIVNRALDLDGTNDYITCGTNNRATNTITISARVRTTVNGASQFIVNKYLSGGIGYYLFINATGYASFQGRNHTGTIKSSGYSTAMVADNQWHDITGVLRSPDTWEIWVDGVLQNSGTYITAVTGISTTAPLLIGQFGGTYSALDIDRVAIWSSALSAGTILANATGCLLGNEANLSGLFTFNEGSGTVATDLSVTAVNGTLTNMNVPSCWIVGPLENCVDNCSVQMGNTVTVAVNTAPAQPTISASGSTTLCSGGSVTLTASAGTSYLWSTGETTASIVVSTAGTYTVQVTNAAGCQSVASLGTTVIVGTPPTQPTISAGGTTTFCAGGSVTLTSSAGTSYLWSNGATTASISPTTSGTYTVQVTNASGCQSVASLGTTVTVNALPTQPTISAGGPTTFCTGGSVTLTASIGTSYLWSTGATTASISPSTAGTYTVQVTNAAGCQSVASAGTTVTVNTLPSQPTISAGGLTTFCAGGSVTLTASSGTTYLWSTGATTSSIAPTTAGIYTVQVTNAAGCLSAASLGTTVTVNALPTQPTITAGGPTTFCAGGSVTLNSSAGTSYFWSNGATATSTNITTSGTYTLQVTNAFGCMSIPSAGTTVTVNSLPAQPTITAGGPTTFCTGGSVTLTASAGSGYLWSDGSMSPSINVSSTSTYTVQVTNAAGCQSVASAAIIVTENTLPNAPIISPNAPTTFCDGGTVNLASSAGITYLWSNGATTASIDLTTGGTFTVQITGTNGCQSLPSAPTTVVVNPNPIISSGTVLNPTSCTVDNGSIQVNGTETGTISWTGAGSGTLSSVTMPTIIPNLGDGGYLVTFTNSSTCVSNTLNVTLSAPSAPSAPSISAGGSTTFCAGGSVTLMASTGSTYLWSNGETTANIVATTAGNYTVTITDAAGCSSPSSAATAITLIDLPVISTGTLTNPSSCTVSDGTIEVLGNETGDLNWTGTSAGSLTGITLPTTVNSLANGNYNFTFTAASGCVSLPISGTLTLPSAPPAPIISAGGSTTLCEGDLVSLTSTSGDSYLWSNGATTQSIDVDLAGTYTVTVTDLAGCTSPTSAGTVVVVNAIPSASTTVSGITITATNASATYQWIDCGNANQPIAGATSQSFTPTVNGSYAVIVTQNNCSDTSVCTPITSVGIDSNTSLIDIRLQPNPTFNEVTIVSDFSIEKVEVYTTSGQLVQVENTKSFTVGHLSTGVYLVKVYTADGNSTLRLVKN
jgi:hypothetical protein